MALSRSRIVAAAVSVAIFSFAVSPGFAQSGGDTKPADPQKQADAAKDRAKEVQEYVEATKAISGPAGNPECVWLGRNVIDRLWRDDLDTAFRHLDLYDRFGCPGAHIQAAFRCLARQGKPDLKSPEGNKNRVHPCWINPEQTVDAQPAAATAAPAATPTPANAAPATPPAAPAAAAPPAEKR